MKLSDGIKAKHGDSKSHVIKLLNGQKHAGNVWNEFLTNKLFALGFEKSKVNVLSRVSNFIVHVNDGSFLGKSECQLSNIKKELQDVGLDTSSHIF